MTSTTFSSPETQMPSRASRRTETGAKRGRRVADDAHAEPALVVQRQRRLRNEMRRRALAADDDLGGLTIADREVGIFRGDLDPEGAGVGVGRAPTGR